MNGNQNNQWQNLGVMGLFVLMGVFLLLGCPSQVTEKSGKDKADFHYELANNAFFANSAVEAMEELDTVLGFEPEHAKAHHLLGMIYFGRDNLELAEKHLLQSIESDPELKIARNNLGTLYLKAAEDARTNRPEDAQYWWKKALDTLLPLVGDRRYPTPHLVHNNLGVAFHRLGRFDKAEAHYQHAIRLKPRMCRAHCSLGELYIQTRRYDVAVKALDRSIKTCEEFLSKGFNEPYLHLGRVYELTGQIGPARKSYERCYELGPETPIGAICGRRIAELKVGQR